jgi:hypothetical protein
MRSQLELGNATALSRESPRPRWDCGNTELREFWRNRVFSVRRNARIRVTCALIPLSIVALRIQFFWTELHSVTFGGRFLFWANSVFLVVMRSSACVSARGQRSFHRTLLKTVVITSSASLSTSASIEQSPAWVRTRIAVRDYTNDLFPDQLSREYLPILNESFPLTLFGQRIPPSIC